jgi:hypothetical protein
MLWVPTTTQATLPSSEFPQKMIPRVLKKPCTAFLGHVDYLETGHFLLQTVATFSVFI